MKNITIMIVAMACLASVVTAQDANLMNYVQIYAPGTSLALTSSAVDVSDYKGNATFAAQFGPYTQAATGTVTFVHSTTSGGTYTTITNQAGTAMVITQIGPATNDIQTLDCDLARLHIYVKAIVTQAGDTNAISAFMVAPMKSE